VSYFLYNIYVIYINIFDFIYIFKGITFRTIKMEFNQFLTPRGKKLKEGDKYRGGRNHVILVKTDDTYIPYLLNELKAECKCYIIFNGIICIFLFILYTIQM